ncbi:MAG: hypothetical protein AAF958_11810, partial [Planctomycetota bacterium]
MSQCPECDESVLVPEVALSDNPVYASAQAFCPWCQAFIPLPKLARIPVVQIVDSEGAPLPVTTHEHAVVDHA